MPLSGGAINRAARVETAGGPVFVKWQDEPPPAGTFAAEAAGLEELRRQALPELLGVPEVVAQGETFLALSFHESREPRDLRAFTERFASGLAELHRRAARPGRYGLDRDNYLGLWPQPNAPCPTWAEFYRDRRLLPQIETARTAGLLDPERERLLMGVAERLGDLLDGIPGEGCLLHGDLWSGNFLCADGDMPCLIDPAAYYGHREMEVAYVELFGGFPPGFVAAYDTHFPLDAGYGRRRALHQLYHLVNHWNHFGEPYGRRVAEVCRAYLAG
jgi:fructosamine-3-kinase